MTDCLPPDHFTNATPAVLPLAQVPEPLAGTSVAMVPADGAPLSLLMHPLSVPVKVYVNGWSVLLGPLVNFALPASWQPPPPGAAPAGTATAAADARTARGPAASAARADIETSGVGLRFAIRHLSAISCRGLVTVRRDGKVRGRGDIPRGRDRRQAGVRQRPRLARLVARRPRGGRGARGPARLRRPLPSARRPGRVAAPGAARSRGRRAGQGQRDDRLRRSR